MEDPEGVSPLLCNILQQDDLGSWLPFALYDLISVQCTKTPDIEKVFRGWGLNYLADRIKDARRNRDVDTVVEFFKD